MDFTSNSHEDLLEAVRSGQTDALDDLLGVYRNYLKLLARTQIHARLHPKIDPSDLVQDALLDAYRGFDRFRGQTTQELIAWLRQILVRKLADQIKHQRAEKRNLFRERSLDEAINRSSQEVVAALNAAVSSPSDRVSAHEQSVVLADALERLPKEYREAITLRQFERLSFKEVAQKLDRSPGAARMLFARAINRLRRELQEVNR